MRNLICLFLLLSLLLAGCRPADSPVVTTGNAIALPTPNLTLKPCIVARNITAECGFLHVPEDRSNPNSRILDLYTVVVRAYGPNRAPDPLFYITGGPGGYATAESIVADSHNFFFSKVNAQHDLIFVDQRGSNGKHRLSCAPPPSDIINGTQQQMDDWMKKCLSILYGDPRFYTTAVAMRDLDDARQALGYDKINLYGGSYGAAAAQVYMRMFRDRVRTAVLDHGTALDVPFRYVLPRASQSALDQVFAYCEQDEKCHEAYPDIRGDWEKVLDRLAKGPVTLNYTSPGADTPNTVKMEEFAEAIHNLMFKAGTYVQIPALVHGLATHEDWTPVVKAYSERNRSSGPAEPFLLMKEVIFCFEPAWGVQPDQVARFSPDSYAMSLQIKILQSEQNICEALPKPDPSLIYSPGTPAPLSALMLNSLIDPQNPPSNMEPALKEFTKSRMVVEPTEGHQTEAFASSQCRWNIIAQYIEQGSVDGLDISCIEEQKASFETED
jgi:pimeloyl-ACP methyl ester carboxylesterase